MLSAIFQVKGITDKVTKNRLKNLYHRVYNANNGNVNGLTVELISEIEGIISAETKKTLDSLKRIKKQVAERENVQNAA